MSKTKNTKRGEFKVKASVKKFFFTLLALVLVAVIPISAAGAAVDSSDATPPGENIVNDYLDEVPENGVLEPEYNYPEGAPDYMRDPDTNERPGYPDLGIVYPPLIIPPHEIGIIDPPLITLPPGTRPPLNEIRANLVSAIDDSPFTAIFDPLTGRISSFNINGESIGYRYVANEAAFWELVEINRRVTGLSVEERIEEA